jgi:hypothetical protein
MTRTHKRSSPPMVQRPTSLTVNNQRPSFGQTMKEGFGLGVGVSVAQHAVNGVMNFLTPPKSSSVVEPEQSGFEPTKLAKQVEYDKCMIYSSDDYDLCKTLLD